MEEEITAVSSKGQVVLPVGIRKRMNISKGTKMVVAARSGVIIMKPLKKLSELEGILSEMKKESKDVVEEIRKEWDVKLEVV